MSYHRTKNILITGMPGVGKTTLVRRIVDRLKDMRWAGFYTAEIRQGGVRKGFELIDITGRRQPFAHVRIKSPFRVGKYGVDVKHFEDFLDAIDIFGPDSELIVIDEIGKMECFSDHFICWVEEILSSKKPVLATIALKGGGLIERAKLRQDCVLFEVTPESRDRLVSIISDRILN
jgi:nucleoside-triphosphatase